MTDPCEWDAVKVTRDAVKDGAVECAHAACTRAMTPHMRRTARTSAFSYAKEMAGPCSLMRSMVRMMRPGSASGCNGGGCGRLQKLAQCVIAAGDEAGACGAAVGTHEREGDAEEDGQQLRPQMRQRVRDAAKRWEWGRGGEGSEQ